MLKEALVHIHFFLDFVRLFHLQNIIQRRSDLTVIKSLTVFTSVQCSDSRHHITIAFYRLSPSFEQIHSPVFY